MFEGFAKVWTIVGLSRELPRGKPLPFMLAGERLVFFRDAWGAPAALIDRCPHRGVALSRGCVEKGELRCPFHGWRFGADGRNLSTPWNPDSKRERLSAVSLPLREKDGLLWLYTAPGPAPSEPVSPDSVLPPKARLCGQSAVWKAHWTRVMENMLDSAHVPFVHSRTFGGGLAKLLRERPDARMEVAWEPQAHGAKIAVVLDGAPRPAALDYRFPNAMELTLDAPGRLFRILAVCLPLSDHETRLLLVTVRDFLRPAIFDPLFRWINGRIAEEDRAIVESSQPLFSPPPGEEASVRTDAATLAFRRIYHERLSGRRA